MTRNLALELAPVRVNVIAAGFVDTPLSERLLGEKIEDRRNQLRRKLPIRRVVGPADVAALAVHIMTNTALTGATYDIDGGQQLVSMLEHFFPGWEGRINFFRPSGVFGEPKGLRPASLRRYLLLAPFELN